MNNVCAAHTSYIDNILDQLMEFTESLSASQGKIALVSGYTGQLISQKNFNIHHIGLSNYAIQLCIKMQYKR